MTRAMDYRGPDGIHHWTGAGVALGHCMMHTTEESLCEVQPLCNEDESLVLVMDGYLTNWEELRRDLLQRGVRLRTRSDAELVLRAYEVWGDDCPLHVEGEYAFLIWDSRRREAYCARDHQGLRHLHYHWDGKTLVVATDIAGVLAGLPETPPLNRGILSEFMAAYFVTPDETVWQGVKRPPIAHRIRVGAAGPRISEYWQLPLDVTIRYKRDEEYFDHYRELITDCVRRASRSHTPLGFEVSGGLDSSSIFCLAHMLKSKGHLLAPDAKGYTFKAPAGDYADEIEYARAISRKLGVSMTEVPLFCPDISWSKQQAASDRDYPAYANTVMLISLGEAMVPDGCRVSINGQGGDMWLNGNRRYYHEAIRELDLTGLGKALLDDRRVLGLPRSIREFVLQGLGPFAPEILKHRKNENGIRKIFNSKSNFPWLSDDLRRELMERSLRALNGSRSRHHAKYKRDILAPALYHHLFYGMDRQYARIGLEGRSPMLSKEFICFSVSTPERIKLRGMTHKYTHRMALADSLPDEVRNRPDKAEFSVVYDHHKPYFANSFLDELPANAEEFVNPAGLNRLINAFCRDESNNFSNWELWGVFASMQLIILRTLINKIN